MAKLYDNSVDSEKVERIRKIMQAENLNLGQFANEIGVGISTLSHTLNGRNNVSLDVLEKILLRFNQINSEWLILGQGSMSKQIKPSQEPTLFDNSDENIKQSTTYLSNYSKNTLPDNFTNGKKNELINEKRNTPVLSATSEDIPTSHVRDND